jgi:hypothetical protein
LHALRNLRKSDEASCDAAINVPNRPPVEAPPPPSSSSLASNGPVVRRERLGGVLRHYERAAA